MKNHSKAIEALSQPQHEMIEQGMNVVAGLGRRPRSLVSASAYNAAHEGRSRGRGPDGIVSVCSGGPAFPDSQSSGGAGPRRPPGRRVSFHPPRVRQPVVVSLGIGKTVVEAGLARRREPLLPGPTAADGDRGRRRPACSPHRRPDLRVPMGVCDTSWFLAIRRRRNGSAAGISSPRRVLSPHFQFDV